MDEKLSYLIKIVLTGEFGVGKTSFMKNVISRHFPPNQLVVDFANKIVRVNGKLVKAQIWDTGSFEKFKAFTNPYYHGANAVMLFYDISDLNSFNSLTRWLDNILKNTKPNVVIMLVGNKCDLPEAKRQISTERGENFAKQHNLLFYEISVRNYTNVDEALMKLIEKTVSKLEEKEM